MSRRRSRPFRLLLWLGVLGAVLWYLQRQREREPLGPVTAPVPPAPKAAWVVPDPGGGCPSSHPIKAKLSSKLFHLPGMFAYDRTNPDRCYRDEAAAEADGLRRAKR